MGTRILVSGLAAIILMTIRSAYIAFLVTSIASYSLFLFSVFTSDWIELSFTTSDNTIVKDYGLFFVCTTLIKQSSMLALTVPILVKSTGASALEEVQKQSLDLLFNSSSGTLGSGGTCVRFPEPHTPLCQNYVGLCEIWNVATSFSLFSLFAGAWLMYGLLEIVSGGSSHRSRGWSFLAIYIALYGKSLLTIIKKDDIQL